MKNRNYLICVVFSLCCLMGVNAQNILTTKNEWIIDKNSINSKLPDKLMFSFENNKVIVKSQEAMFTYTVSESDTKKVLFSYTYQDTSSIAWAPSSVISEFSLKLNGTNELVGTYKLNDVLYNVNFKLLIWCCTNHDPKHSGSSSQLIELKDIKKCTGFQHCN